jgi:hypothetical protein
MPRKSRIDATGALHHIICRGIERRNIFQDDTDRDQFVMEAKGVLTPGKQPHRVIARTLLCYWAVRELGIGCMVVAQKLSMTQPGVSRAVERGRKLAGNYELIKDPGRIL